MSVEQELFKRSGSKCELCAATENLSVLEVSPSDGSAHTAVLVCATCKEQARPIGIHLCKAFIDKNLVKISPRL